VKWYVLDWLGKKVRVPALKAQGKLWFHWQGQTQVIDLNESARRGGASQGKAQGVITAPMPGKVTKVHVKIGDKVSSGQPVVVMEAMKMEYTLESDLSGIVRELNCKTGDQVGLSQLLARIADA
jgi:acetyl/propionyl-CoA carboxylase alpha subunit